MKNLNIFLLYFIYSIYLPNHRFINKLTTHSNHSTVDQFIQNYNYVYLFALFVPIMESTQHRRQRHYDNDNDNQRYDNSDNTLLINEHNID